jgi:hypothetical protein
MNHHIGDPARALLAVLGMTIAAAGAILALNTAYRVNDYLSVRTRGGLVFSLWNASQTPERGLVWDDHPAFTPGLADGMKLDYPAIEAISRVAYRSWDRIEVKGILYRPSIAMGVDEEYGRVADLEMLAGRFISAVDVAEGNSVVVLSRDSARALFGDPARAVGEGIVVQVMTETPDRREDGGYQWRRTANELRVVGVYRDLPPMLRDLGGVGHFIVPITMGMGPAAAAGIMHLRLKGGGESEARVRLADLVRARLGKDTAVSAWRGNGPDADAQIRDTQRQRNGVSLFFGLFACAVFLVSAVGLAAVMTAEYLEREHDIGIRRSLGATRYSVAYAACVRAFCVTGIGLAIGACTAAALSRTVLAAVFPILYADADVFAALGIPSGISIRPVAIACALAAVSTVFAGLFPGISILRARPAENLRG